MGTGLFIAIGNPRSNVISTSCLATIGGGTTVVVVGGVIIGDVNNEEPVPGEVHATMARAITTRRTELRTK